MLNSIFFFENRAVYEIMRKKYDRIRHATYDNIIQRMRSACWVLKTTDTHIPNMQYLLLFHGHNGYANAPQCYILHILPVFFRLFYSVPAMKTTTCLTFKNRASYI